MLDEEFRVSPERAAEQNLTKYYNWELYTPSYLQPVIIVEDGIALELGEAIKEIVKKIAEKHDKPLQKVEVINGSSATYLGNRTVLVRWTSCQGVYERAFEVYKTIVTKPVLHPRPARV